MSDLKCPYCDADCEVCHDDGFGYAEDAKHEMSCHACEKNFTFETFISFAYEAKQADCLNGGEHKLNPVIHVPRVYPDWVRCRDCEYQHRGDYKEITNDR
jgi:hypothetical protein